MNLGSFSSSCGSRVCSRTRLRGFVDRFKMLLGTRCPLSHEKSCWCHHNGGHFLGCLANSSAKRFIFPLLYCSLMSLENTTARQR